jgi:dolichyl-phosphate beta-glucosyltransferase
MLSIIVPAYNEEQRLVQTLHKLLTYLEKQKILAEIIVINDGSTDRTEALAKEIQKNTPSLKVSSLPMNAGKGRAIRKGIEISKGDHVLIMDADGAAAMHDMSRLLDAKESADIIIGSRYTKESIIPVQPPLGRRILTAASRVANRILGIRVKDSRCGFKLIRGEVARKIISVLSVDRFGFDVELLFVANKWGLTIREIPITWSHKEGSKVRFARDSFKAVIEITQILFNSMRGNYRL